MEITINGKQKKTDEGLSVMDLLNNLSLGEKPVVVEINGKIIAREQYHTVLLREADNIEVVRLVGGG